MAYSTVWSGSISFGLVNIPIKLYTVTDISKDFSFNRSISNLGFHIVRGQGPNKRP
jgi:non-homologous end joining protein Ku